MNQSRAQTRRAERIKRKFAAPPSPLSEAISHLGEVVRASAKKRERGNRKPLQLLKAKAPAKSAPAARR